MRERDDRSEGMFICIRLEERVPLDHPVRATLLQTFYCVHSERQLREQIAYNLLFRWFVGLPMHAGV